MRHLICLVALLPLPCAVIAQSESVDEEELRRLHSELIRAHVECRPDLWMSLESARYVSANGGTVTFPTPEERREQRAAYLESATFSRYHDLREPVVRVSADGTLGWLIAEVEVEGTLARGDGGIEEFHQIWAWVELYERDSAGWRLVGNVSNSRDG